MMTENGASSSTANGDASRGLPYYEKLRKDLQETLQKKRNLDKQMAMIEDDIWRSESLYLEETTAGNIIKGFDNYIKGTGTAPSTTGATNPGTSTRRKGNTADNDRIFSRSSVSFMREVSPGPSESGRDTPRIEDAGNNKNKKKKASNVNGSFDGENDDARVPKRLKINFSRGTADD